MVCRTFFIVAVGFAYLAVPAAAKTLELEPSTEWKRREYDDKCRMSRVFGEGEDSVTLWIDQGGSQPHYNLTLIGRPMRYPAGPAVRIRFGQEPEVIRSYISAKSSKGRPVLRMFGVTITQPDNMKRGEDEDVPEIAITESDANNIDALYIRYAIVEPVTLKLGPMAAPLAFLQGCGERLELLLSEAGRALSAEAKPPTALDPDRWLNAGDYPNYLAKAQMEGTLKYRLTVSKTGRATSCFITQSNKPQLFDDAMCLGLMKGARFEPAFNAQGEPIASYYIGSVTFNMR